MENNSRFKRRFESSLNLDDLSSVVIEPFPFKRILFLHGSQKIWSVDGTKEDSSLIVVRKIEMKFMETPV